ncbi:hypothetical protein F4859DRAFT_466151 [Xylaria cf. heliscus]|nr:hypothetical protein F4859DRAFT_466151 [Xylaria cf. heliscus]
MPKRKKNMARAQQRAEAITRSSKQQKANNTSKPKAPKSQLPIQSSQEEFPDPCSSQALGTRFANLPAELRAEIFAWLLVRPIKWSAEHREDCPLRNPELTSSPFDDIRPRMVPSRNTCPLSYCGRPVGLWRSRLHPIYVDPWRSEWAPVITNEFLCSTCWDSKFYGGPIPRVDSLPCLCARKRRDGFAALLVCKQWYEECARVFYTRNTFAFATPGEFTSFFAKLNPRWSALVNKVSLLALAPIRNDYNSTGDELKSAVIDAKELREAWGVLQKLPALSKLELDALFLTRPGCVKVFRGKPLKNLRKVEFSQSVPMMLTEAPREFVWPRRALRKVIENNDFSVSVARGIKGMRYGWVKGPRRGDQEAIVMEKKRYRDRFKTDKAQDGEDEAEMRFD